MQTLSDRVFQLERLHDIVVPEARGGKVPTRNLAQRVLAPLVWLLALLPVGGLVVLLSGEAAAVARQLQSATSIRRAASLVAHLRLLGYQITEGRDLNEDGQLSFDGEAGMQQLDAHLYLLLEGEGRARELR